MSIPMSSGEYFFISFLFREGIGREYSQAVVKK
ncbi:Uncharacterised protein [Wolinella succinogenes]|nr:Uncharacterised protein [Wolinella succinogenes]